MEIDFLKEENERLKKQYAKEEKKLFHDNEILQDRIDKALELIKMYIVDFNICHNVQDYDRIEVEVFAMKSLIKILKGEE